MYQSINIYESEYVRLIYAETAELDCMTWIIENSLL